MDNQEYWRNLYEGQKTAQAQNSWVGTGIGTIGSAFPNMVDKVKKNIMKRKRHKFLYEIAEKIVSIIEESGVTRDEGCELRALVEKIWDMEKEDNG